MADKKKFFPTYHIYSPLELDKTWFVYYVDEYGRRVRVYRGLSRAKTREKRLAAAHRLIEELSANYEPAEMPLRDKVYEQLEDMRMEWKLRTYQSNKSRVDLFYQWVGQRFLTKELVHAFFKDLKRNRHNTTYNSYLVVLRKVFTDIGRPDLFEGLRPVKERKTPARYFQEHQVKRLKRHIQAKDPELWLFIQFIYYCFIRPGGELRYIKASDILLDEDKILIRGEISKNNKTQYVAIPAAFKPHLHFIEELNPGDLLFPSRRDPTKPIGRNTMTSRHRKFLKELGFGTEYKLYSWKHTGAVRCAKEGVNLKQLQMQLRHHSLDQVNEYLRQMGVQDMSQLKEDFPGI